MGDRRYGRGEVEIGDMGWDVQMDRVGFGEVGGWALVYGVAKRMVGCGIDM